MPAVFFIEETKYKDTGRIKLANYDIFELVRESKDGGGGLALGCLKELQPAWVREGDDLVEALSVEIWLKEIKIRCCVAYGCQETEAIDRKEAFWTYVDEEIYFASQSASGFVMHFDGNLWAGSHIVPGDPRPQNRNGRLFQSFLERHPHLTVVNSLPLCEGLITRIRTREGRVEKSVLDFFVVCDRVLPYITRMVIDEERNYILTNFEHVRKGGEATHSDHNTQFMDMNLKIESVKPIRTEMFNFKNSESQAKFKQMTSETSEFTNCFKSNESLLVQIENWQKVLKKFCSKAFSKIRIKKQKIYPFEHEYFKFN